MTTPTPQAAGAPVTTGSFQQVLWPPDVAQMVNLLIGGSPFAASLTQYPTSRHEVAWPTAAPDQPVWTAEGAPLPVIGLHDAASIVAVAKLGEILMLSNESVADTSVNLTMQVGNLLRDAAGPELDRGLLYGNPPTVPAEPKGVVPIATAVDGTALDVAITTAVGQIGDQGGAANVLAAKPSLLAKWRNLRDTQQRPLYPDGIGALFGLTEVGVPNLADTLVYDSTRMFFVVRTQDFEVAISQEYAFASDSLAVRVRGRFAVGCPAPGKTLRKITVTGVAPTLEDRPSRKAA
jgi:HK97 family phage major capsid protein